MNTEDLKKMIERLNPKGTVKAIRVYKKSFKIVFHSDTYKSVIWCHFPITDVEDNPKWRSWFHII